MSRGAQRWAIFVHDPDGDMGEGMVVGAFKSSAAADEKAEKIRDAAGNSERVECIVLPLVPGSIGGKAASGAVQGVWAA